MSGSNVPVGMTGSTGSGSVRLSAAVSKRAFSLIEILVATTVLIIIMVLMLSLVSSTSSIWRSTTGKVQAFQTARAAMDTMSRSIAQAVLAPYWDYYDVNGVRTPLWDATQPYASVNPTAQYGRFSDLHFVVGQGAELTQMPSVTHAIFFQAPLGFSSGVQARGLDNVLNVAGYYIEYGSDEEWLPGQEAIRRGKKDRFRLIEVIQPAELMNVFTSGTTINPAYWITENNRLGPYRRILADNIIALIVHPKPSVDEVQSGLSSLGASYFYNSRSGGLTDPKRHQLPPMIGLTLIALDESSVVRFESGDQLRTTIENIMQGKFQDPGTDANSDGVADRYNEDLEFVKAELTKKNLTYRVFTANVGIRAAKWSEQ